MDFLAFQDFLVLEFLGSVVFQDLVAFQDLVGSRDSVEFLVLVDFQEPQDSAGYQVTLESAVILAQEYQVSAVIQV
ncbi:MAG: hypothetical protein EB072_18685 [Betaproteobacteria bacterium]|nr:hypothetical protein [Betaproteobacteria bacterium]NDD14609.1 hypothetical protein [Betaproteobacteria bacterium]